MNSPAVSSAARSIARRRPCISFVACHLDDTRRHAAPRPVLAGLQLEGADLAVLLAVEAGATLLAQRPALDQLAEHRRHGEGLALWVVRQRGVAVVGDRHRHIDPDQVQRAEGGALRTPNELPGEVVDLVDSQPQLRGETQRSEHAVHAEPVGDEGRCVLRSHRALAEQA